jgi:hypothetical protein
MPYLKTKIEKVESNSNTNNIRDLYWDISDFKKGFQAKLM